MNRMSMVNAFDPANTAALDAKSQALIARRQQALGPAYRLFYEEPLHLVRGEGVWLYDSAGEAYLDAYNNVASIGHAQPDVVRAISGQSATLARREGFAGAVVDGTLRDPDQYRQMGWPVWCRGFTPITGKWRLETLEVNGAVEICGIPCHPGDLICADSAGVCIVPRALVDTVIEICERFERGDSARQADIDAGVILPDLVKRTYK